MRAIAEAEKRTPPPASGGGLGWGLRGRRIGLLGGSFNPAHGGHLHISRLALQHLGLDEVWWLVSPQNPLKPPAGMAPFAERLAQARAAAAAERTRIARELHDVVGHSVTVMMVQAGAARMLVETDPAAARERLLAVEESGREALAEARRMLTMLRDGDEAEALGPQPSVSDLDRLVAEARSAGCDVGLTVEGEPALLPPGEALAAYRIVQEALTNARKHAAGARVDVRLRYLPSALELAVENDGVDGDGANAWTGAAGHGVIGMRERVHLYGGRLDVGPRPDGGFAVRARLPIESAEGAPL